MTFTPEQLYNELKSVENMGNLMIRSLNIFGLNEECKSQARVAAYPINVA